MDEDNNDDLIGTGRGTTTYVYLDDDPVYSGGSTPTVVADGTATIVIVNTYAAEITRVDDGTIVLDDVDEPGLEFDVEGYDEEDVVLYTKSTSNGTSWNVEQVLGLAERVEGEATTIRDEDRVTVDGTTYRYSTKFNTANGNKLDVNSVDENVDFYLDNQGNIVMIDEADESNDYAYVLSVGSQDDLYGGSGTYGARLILADGTSMRVTLDDDTADRAKDDTDVSDQNPAEPSDTGDDWKVYNYYINRLVSYSEEDDGTYSMRVVTTNEINHTDVADGRLYTADDEDVIRNGTSRVVLPGADSGYIYTDSNTVFLLQDRDDDGDDFSAYVGYDNVPDVDVIEDTSNIIYYINSRDVARMVVMTNVTVTGSANDVIAVVNGEATQLEVLASGTAMDVLDDLGDGEVGVFFGMSENGNGYVTRLTVRTPTDVEVNEDIAASTDDGVYTPYVGTQRQSSGGVLTFNTNPVTGDTRGTVRLAGNSDATIVYYDGDDLTVGGSVLTDTNDEAYVVTDDGEVIAVFVYEVANGRDEDDDDEPSTDVELISGTVSSRSAFTYYVEAGYHPLTDDDIEALLLAENCTDISVNGNGEWSYTTSSGRDYTDVDIESNGEQVYEVTLAYDDDVQSLIDAGTISAELEDEYVAANGQVEVTLTHNTSSFSSGFTADSADESATPVTGTGTGTGGSATQTITISDVGLIRTDITVTISR